MGFMVTQQENVVMCTCRGYISHPICFHELQSCAYWIDDVPPLTFCKLAFCLVSVSKLIIWRYSIS